MEASRVKSESDAEASKTAEGFSHTVEEGDCIHRIAEQAGHLAETVWDHPANAEIKRSRPDAEVLLRRDRVFIPALTGKTELGETDRRHTFVRELPRVTLRLRFMDGAEPLAWAPCIFEIGGERHEKQTDSTGFVEVNIRATADRGIVKVVCRNRTLTHHLAIGSLDYHASPSGVLQRLRNLGYGIADPSLKWDHRALAALHEFQRANGLPLTDEPDQATCEKLRELHGC
jgi:N-acetylmuramoyl-L-alanine amidase